jgi:DNA-directed RNA polymerase specialized sigma24 family protein
LTRQELEHWKQYEKFVLKLSWKSFSMAQRRGLPLEFDDIFQEASVAYCRALKGFKPEKGYKFITYLGTAIMTRLANFTVSAKRQLIGQTRSLDAMVDENGDEVDLYEVMPSNEPTPLAQMLLEEAVEETLKGLSPFGLQMLEWCMNPPPDVRREYDGYIYKMSELHRRGLRRQQIRGEPDVHFLFSELLPRLFPSRHREISATRQAVTQAVQAWNL